jgi:hypothetical protein
MRFLRLAAFPRRRHTLMKAKYTTLSTEGQIIIPVEIRLRPITPEFIDSLCGL